MNLTISLRKFLESVASASGLSYETCEKLLGELTAQVTSMLSRGENVSIKGIGTFRMIDDEVVFAPDMELAEKINLPFAAFEAVELPDEVTDAMLEQATDSEVTEESRLEKVTEATEESDSIEKIESGEVTPPPFFPPLPDAVIGAEDETETEQCPMPPIPVITASADEPKDTDAKEPHESSSSHANEEHRGSKWRNLLIAAFFAGMICFFVGYALGRWMTISDSDKKHIATETEDIIAEEASDSVIQQDTVTVAVVAEPTAATETSQTHNAAIVTDTIGRNRFLTTMARQHYGQMEFWVYIYEENADKLGNPNKLDAGTVVVIPPAEKYGIDPSDPKSVEKAKVKANELSARFK